MSADTDSDSCTEVRLMVRQNSFGGYINRTQQTVIEAGLHSWLCIIFANLASLREAQKRTSGVPVGPGCSC